MAQTINQEQIQHVILYIICYSLEYLDLSDFKVSKLTNMEYAFYGYHNIFLLNHNLSYI